MIDSRFILCNACRV